MSVLEFPLVEALHLLGRAENLRFLHEIYLFPNT